MSSMQPTPSSWQYSVYVDFAFMLYQETQNQYLSKLELEIGWPYVRVWDVSTRVCLDTMKWNWNTSLCISGFGYSASVINMLPGVLYEKSIVEKTSMLASAYFLTRDCPQMASLCLRMRSTWSSMKNYNRASFDGWSSLNCRLHIAL